jgi:hypothetical protein
MFMGFHGGVLLPDCLRAGIAMRLDANIPFGASLVKWGPARDVLN